MASDVERLRQQPVLLWEACHAQRNERAVLHVFCHLPVGQAAPPDAGADEFPFRREIGDAPSPRRERREITSLSAEASIAQDYLAAGLHSLG